MKSCFYSILLLFAFLPIKAQFNVDKLIMNGRVALHYEDFVLSIQYFNQAINQKPYLWEPWQLRAIAKYYLDDWKGAETDATKAIELNPYIVSLYDLRGLVKIKQQKYSEAIDDYSLAIKIEPSNQNFWYNKAVCFVEMHKYKQAHELLDSITQRWSKSAAPYVLISEIYLQEKDTIQAELFINKSLERDSNNAEAWRLKANILFSKECWKEAEASYSKALIYKPKDVSCYTRRAIARLNLVDIRGAMSDYDVAIDLYPNNIFAHYNRGLLRAQVGDDNRAIEDFNFVLSLEPYNIMALLNRAILLDNTGDLHAAIRDYTLVIDKFPNFWTGLAYRAKCYRKLGMTTKAEKDEYRIINAQMNKHLGIQHRWTNHKLSEMRKLNEIDPEKYSMLIVDETSNDSHEYKSEYRGRIQNKQEEKQLHPYVVLKLEKEESTIGNYFMFDSNVEEYVGRLKEYNKNISLVPHLGSLQTSSMLDLLSCVDSINTQIEETKHIDELLLLRSIIYSSLQDYTNALTDLDMVLDKDHNNILALWQKAVCLSMINEYEKNTLKSEEINLRYENIKGCYKQLHILSKHNAFIYYNEGTFYARNEDYNKAIESFTRSINIDATMPYSYYNRGIVYMNVGKMDEAYKDLSKAGELGMYKAYSIMKHK